MPCAPACARAAPCPSSARTASPGWSAPAPTARSSAATGSAGTTWRPVAMTVELAGLTLPNPVLVASGCGGTGRELDGVRRPRRRSAASSPARSPSTPAPGGAGAADRRDPVRPGQRGRAAEPRPRPLPRHRAALAGAAGRSASSSRSPAGRWGSTPSSPAGSAAPRAWPASRSTSRRPTRPAPRSFDVREPFHAASVVAAVPRDLPRGMPVLAKLRSDVGPGRRERPHRARRRRRRRRGRQRAARRDARRAARRPERPRDPAARAALRRRGARRAAGRADRGLRAASSTPTTSAPSSPPAPPPSRSAPPCCTTPPPPPGSWPSSRTPHETR